VIPFPAAAIRADFQILPKLFILTSLDGMYLSADNFTGKFLDANASIEYRPWEHVGLGVGYNGMIMHVDNDDRSDYPGVDFAGSVHVQYHGLMFYGKYTF